MIDHRSPADFLILNVDDTEAIRYAKTRALQRAGFQVIEAGTGAEALELVRSGSPALALLDVKLPDMSGIEVCRLIKRDHPGVLVLQISATFISSQDRARGLKSGADYYLTQPVSADELVAAIKALLRTREAESQLREVNEQLEQKVAQGEEALSAEVEHRERVEAALRQSQKMEAIGHLTGGIAHDFNNLLMAILGNLDLLERRLAAGRTDVHAPVANAAEAAKRAAALTQRLLTFARRQPLQAERTSVADLLTGLEPMIQTSVGAPISVRFDLPPEVWPIWCDGHQLENAILNLVINARDAMPDGGTLTLSARNVVLDQEGAAPIPDAKPGEYVRLSVRDTGQGMPPDVAAQAFDPFFTTKPQGQGTGLGLAMLYSFVHQSGGAVDLRTQFGAGTEVALLLPRATQVQNAREREAPQRAAPAGSGEAILVVEDEPLVRELIVENLTEQGYRCLPTESAQEALRLAQSGAEFDLLLSDVGLPGRMDGRQLADWLRSERPDLRVVIISGHAGAEPAQPDPYTAVLPKPFERERLLRTVREMLDAKESREDAGLTRSPRRRA